MSANLNLIKNGDESTESVFLPRFPFGRLVFKGNKETKSHAFEICNLTGKRMHLHLKDGGHSYHLDERIEGELHLFDKKYNLAGKVIWLKGSHLGVEFLQEGKNPELFEGFFCVKTLLLGMCSLMERELPYDLPLNLKHWLRSDGLVEIFVWEHRDGEISKFQMVFLDTFLEWRDGEGIHTAKILGKREHETPLSDTEELIVDFDLQWDRKIVEQNKEIVAELNENLLPEKVLDFLKMKLGI